MLEIHETLKSQAEWDNSSLFNDMDDLMQWARVDYDGDEGDWPDGRVVCAECVVTEGEDVVGMGRILWDSHIDDALPRVAHLCLTPAHRTDFVLESVETVLVEAYAMDPIGGEVVRLSDGTQIDLAEQAQDQLAALIGLAEPRMI
ncbi:hypothetical protein E7681_04140 [Thalassobius vesicularis]|uniref:Uncharacterized protein n=1 Tax=Thalassobius vesicularis TaxID=1294297 RepID=A0A4S3MCR1_9RHOB|nr:hypothetical protein [Thalassobius vesicularis]THD75652.1 hypothetical protein E7681_04140 [Thalassobius vesicularis]